MGPPSRGAATCRSTRHIPCILCDGVLSALGGAVKGRVPTALWVGFGQASPLYSCCVPWP